MKFPYDSITKSEGDHPYYFSCAMISTCDPLFDNLDDNYGVEDDLRKAKVIRGGSTDTESCQLWVYFRTRQQGEAFIDRLNRYLEQRATAMADYEAKNPFKKH